MKITAFSFICSLILIISCKNNESANETSSLKKVPIDSLAKAMNWPAELKVSAYSGPDLTPSPACLAAAATGEVYVGVDMIGSLGKKPGRGMIMKLEDRDNDGVMDHHSEYAAVDNPRGILSIGDKLYVLHTVFNDSVATGMDLVVFEDKDNDGKADGPSKPLIEHISNP